MKVVVLLAIFVVVAPLALAADDADGKPYTGQASNKSLKATDEARKVLLADKAAMKNWTTEQWQSWADERFGANTSADSSTWRDWTKARIKSASDHTVVSGVEELNKPALHWDANDWKLFVDNIDTDYKSSDKYFCVITPNGQDKGKFLLGRWAYAMYEDNLPERQAWEAAQGGGDSPSDAELSAALDLLQKFGQAQLEMLCFLSGLLMASIVANTWKW